MSKKIIIFRKKSLSQLAQLAEMNEIYRTSKIEIGAYWHSQTVSKQGTGLTPKEVKLLLPEILSVREDHYDFNKMIDDYYTNIRIQIPFEGLTLEAGLKDDDKDLSIDNMPLSVEDYVKYKFLLSHPSVAKSEEDALSMISTEVFMVDKSKVKRAEVSKNNIEDKALDVYKNVKDNELKTNMMLQILGINYKEYRTHEERIVELRKLVFDRPKDFIATYEDKHIDLRFLIRFLISKKAIESKFGKIYIIKDNKNELLGHDEEDAIIELTKKEKSDVLMYLKNIAESLVKENVTKK